MDITLVEFTGGTAMGYYATLIANHLRDRRAIDEITLVIPNHMDTPEELDSRVHVTTLSVPESLPRFGVRSLLPSFWHNVTTTIGKRYPDVVHVVSEIRTPSPVVGRLSEEHRTIVTVHEPEAYAPTAIRRLFLNPIQERNTRRLCRHADEVAVHGNNSRRKLVERGTSPTKITIHPLGSFASFFTKHCEEQPTDTSEILFFGRIFPGKGIRYLLEAAAILERDLPNTEFILAGSGNLTPFDDKIAKLDNVTVLNRFIDNDEACRLFRRASIVVFPYTGGSQSASLSIAAECRTPVVATDVGNFSEMVDDGETGLLVPPHDSAALAAALRELIRDDQRRTKMGRAAKRKYQTEFSWDRISETLVQIYETN